MTRVPPRLRGIRVAYYLGRPAEVWVDALALPRREHEPGASSRS
jgi:hypothetical protein